MFGNARLYLLAVVGLMTFTMQQNGFRAAGLPASLPAFAVLEPLVGSLLGLFIYHEHVGGGAARIAIEVIAVLGRSVGHRPAGQVGYRGRRQAGRGLPRPSNAVPVDPAA